MIGFSKGALAFAIVKPTAQANTKKDNSEDPEQHDCNQTGAGWELSTQSGARQPNLAGVRRHCDPNTRFSVMCLLLAQRRPVDTVIFVEGRLFTSSIPTMSGFLMIILKHKDLERRE